MYFILRPSGLCTSTESWKKNARLGPRRMSTSLCNVYVCNYVTRCYRLRLKMWTILSKYEVRSCFISKLFTLCVGKCSPSVIHVSTPSLCQSLHQSLIKNREDSETSGFYSIFTLLVDWKHIIEIVYISYAPIRGLVLLKNHRFQVCS